MVTFSAANLGTDPEVWAGPLDDLDTLDITGLRRLIVVAAHPDDETLGAGGLLASAQHLGVEIVVMVATDGEASHPQSPTHPPTALAEIRQAEVRSAITVVAPDAQVQLLHLPDGALAEHLDELTATIGSQLVPSAAGTWLVAPWSGDGHPDHAAAAAAAHDAARGSGVVVLQYPIWLWHWGSPDGDDLPAATLRLPLAPASAAAKQVALQKHLSQTQPLSAQPGDETLIPARLQEFFDQDNEYFVLVDYPTRTEGSLPGSFFDDFYQDRTDPWEFETRWYEERKRALTLASLPRRRFRSAFEPGCSIGVLTAELAARCDRVLAADIATRPLLEAARRLSEVRNVELRQLRIPTEWPDGRFDLIVLSEVGYYCDSDDLDALLAAAVTSLTEDGVVVACHWRHRVEEYPLGGDDVHRRLRDRPELALLSEHRETDFLLDVFVRPPAISVAAAEGLLG